MTENTIDLTSDLDYILETTRLVRELHRDVFEGTMNQSHGEPTMSPEDVKLCLLQVQGALETHERIILTLAAEIKDLKKSKKNKKKNFWDEIISLFD